MSYDEQVQIEFNLSRIRWLKIDDIVQAMRISSGRVGPPEYYEALCGDKESAASTMGLALLSQMMK